MCIPVLCKSFFRDCSNNRIFGLCRYRMCYAGCCKYRRRIVRLLGIVLADISQYGSKFINRRNCHTLYCYCCLGFRDWSRARMLVSLKRIFRPKGKHFTLLFASAMFWVFGIGRVLACWFRPNRSIDRKGHILRCYLRVHCFGFSGLVACSHAGFA